MSLPKLLSSAYRWTEAAAPMVTARDGCASTVASAP